MHAKLSISPQISDIIIPQTPIWYCRYISESAIMWNHDSMDFMWKLRRGSSFSCARDHFKKVTSWMRYLNYWGVWTMACLKVRVPAFLVAQLLGPESQLWNLQHAILYTIFIMEVFYLFHHLYLLWLFNLVASILELQACTFCPIFNFPWLMEWWVVRLCLLLLMLEFCLIFFFPN